MNQSLVFCCRVEAARKTLTVGYVSNGDSALVVIQNILFVTIFRLLSRCHPLLFFGGRYILLLGPDLLVRPFDGRLAPFLGGHSLVRRLMGLAPPALEVVRIALGDGVVILKGFVLVKAHIISAEFVFFDAILFHQAQITHVLKA